MNVWESRSKTAAPEPKPKREERARAKAVEKAQKRDKKRHSELMTDYAMFDATKGIEYIESSLERCEMDGEPYDSTLDLANRMYAKALMLHTIQPILQSGGNITKDDVKRVIGTGVAYYLIDPQFRNDINNTITDKLMPHVKQDAISAAPGTPKAVLRDKIECRTGERLPLNVKSASMLYLGISKSAYEEMRMPGANQDEIAENYRRHVDQLVELAGKDGISKDRLNKGIRSTYGQLCKMDPSLEYVFSETAYSKVERAPGSVEHDFIQGARIWNGEYVRTDTQQAYTDRFQLRRPMTLEDRREVMDDHLGRGFAACHDYEDLKAVFAQPMEWQSWPEEKRQKYGWVEEWRSRGDRFMQMSMDDCWTNEERDAIEKEWADAAEWQLQGWVDAHPQYAEQVIRDNLGKSEVEFDESIFDDDPDVIKNEPDPHGASMTQEEFDRRRAKLKHMPIPEESEHEFESPDKR